MGRDSSISRLGSAIAQSVTRPFTARSTKKVQPVTSYEIDHIAVCDPAGYEELNEKYNITSEDNDKYIDDILHNDDSGVLHKFVYDIDLDNISKNKENIYRVNHILKLIDEIIKSTEYKKYATKIEKFKAGYTRFIKETLRESIIYKTKDMDLSDKKDYIIRIKQNLQKICAVNVEHLLEDIKIGGSHKKSAKKSTKKGSKKRSAKKSTKKGSKKHSVKKSVKKVKKASKKRSAKKSTKKRSAKKSTKKRSTKKSSKKRSAKKSTKKASKKRSAKKLIAIKSQQKKRSAKKSMAKKW
jgi:hypothetical protein